jgi:hypothetical protein
MVMKPRKMRYVGYGASTGSIRNVYKILFRKPKKEETTWKN